MNPVFLPFVGAIAANSYLSFGFGLSRLVSSEPGRPRRALGPALAIMLSCALVWPLFSYALAPSSLGFMEPLLLAPVAVLASIAADAFSRRMPIGDLEARKQPDTSAQSAFDGLAYGASYFVLRYASSYAEALLFAAGAASGYLFCDFVLRAVRERSDTEPVPRCLRGTPLMLIASALLAVIASFFAAASFSVWGRPL